MLEPATCTSMGAGRPRFSTASTRPPDWKYALSSGRSRGDAVLHARHVFVAAGLVVFLEADLHEGRVLRGVGGVDGGEIGRGADVGNDHAEVFRRNHLAHQVLHLGDFVFGDGEARAGGRFEIDHELAGVGARKERETEQRERERG